MIYSLGVHIGKSVSNRITRYIIRKLNDLFQSIYSGWISNQLMNVGKKFSINAPCRFTGLKYIKIGDNFSAGRRLRLEAIYEYKGVCYSPQIVIGNNVQIEEDCHIGCINRVEIGNNVLIAGRVFITDHSHGTTDDRFSLTEPKERLLYSKGETKIGNNVWIGEGAVILSGVVIGANSIVGANAVVTKNFPCDSIIVGNPAKVQ